MQVRFSSVFYTRMARMGGETKDPEMRKQHEKAAMHLFRKKLANGKLRNVLDDSMQSRKQVFFVNDTAGRDATLARKWLRLPEIQRLPSEIAKWEAILERFGNRVRHVTVTYVVREHSYIDDSQPTPSKHMVHRIELQSTPKIDPNLILPSAPPHPANQRHNAPKWWVIPTLIARLKRPSELS